MKHDDVARAHHGIVSAFDLQGDFLGRIRSMGALNWPWRLAIISASFGSFGGDLLVGNFGDAMIDVFNLDHGAAGIHGTLRRPAVVRP